MEKQWVCTGISKSDVKDACDKIFVKYDRNKSGRLDANEFYSALCEVFALLKHSAPPAPHAMSVMQAADANRDGMIEFKEFKRVVKSICNLKKKK